MSYTGFLSIMCGVENPRRRGDVTSIEQAVVDDGSLLSWFPAPLLEASGIERVRRVRYFVMSDGRSVMRDVGFAIVHVNGRTTVDDVVFGQPGDRTLLGARALDGLRLRVDASTNTLVDAGPFLAASAA